MKPANAPEGLPEVKHRLRQRIGDYRFDVLSRKIRAMLPDPIDRAVAYELLCELAFSRAVDSALKARRWRRTADAVERVGRAIEDMKDVIRQDLGISRRQVDNNTAELEGAYKDLQRTYGIAPRVQLGIASTGGGRPAGNRATVDALQELDGMSRSKARELLDIAFK